MQGLTALQHHIHLGLQQPLVVATLVTFHLEHIRYMVNLVNSHNVYLIFSTPVPVTQSLPHGHKTSYPILICTQYSNRHYGNGHYHLQI